MSQADVPLPQKRGIGVTSRIDGWWIAPALTFIGLALFLLYANIAAFQAAHYEFDGYLSPMYSPLLFAAGSEYGETTVSHHVLFGPWPSWLGWLPDWIPASPALIILIFPAGFRMTCYYYRGAYYKAFWADPLNCSVGESRKSYWGEQTWPLIAQNIHRYFFYAAAIYIFILGYDAIRGLFFTEQWHGKMLFGGEATTGFGLGVGTFVLTLNVILLGGYTFGCHSARHLMAGRFNIFSKHPTRKVAYECISCLNRKHMLWAWCSLVWVGFTDFYIRMCSMGIFTDLRFF